MTPAGSVSVTVMAPTVAPLPTFVATSVHVPFWPWMKFAAWRLSNARSGTPCTAVGSLSRSLAALRSPGVATVAALTTPGTAAESTFTVIVKLVLSAAEIESEWVAVTICPDGAKLQPAPFALANVMPAGSVSVTVVAPVVAAEPRFETTSVQEPV